MVWDATVSCTFAESHMRDTKDRAGAAAEKAEASKMRKYEALQPRYILTPVAFETTGVGGPMTMKFVKDLGRRIRSVTGDPREGEFLRQRLAVAVQRGNAISIQLGILGVTQDVVED